MLDLSITNKSYMTVKMPDKEVNSKKIFSKKPTLVKGDIVHVLPPKRKLLAVLKDATKILKEDENLAYEIVANILSNNKCRKLYTADDIEDLTIIDVSELLQGYVDFINQLQNHPN